MLKRLLLIYLLISGCVHTNSSEPLHLSDIHLSSNNTLFVVGAMVELHKRNFLPRPWTISERFIQDLKSLEDKKFEEINIVINSPGGSVQAGLGMIKEVKRLQKLGVTINCIVKGTAGSMAVSLFTACSNRYAVIDSTLMWHEIRRFMPQGIATVEDLKHIYEEANSLNEEVWKFTRSKFPKKFFKEHLKKETYHNVSQLDKLFPKYLTVINSLIVTKGSR